MRLTFILGSTFIVLACGCTRNFYVHRAQSQDPSDVPLPQKPHAPRDLIMFEGHSGRVATWADLMAGVYWADVIVIGELHGDKEIHAFERAVVEDCSAAFPGTVVSLEMLERDEQVVVDQWMAREIDTETLILETNSANWAGEGSWQQYYQPVLDTARANGAKVVAANAPREYVRQARLEGYQALESRPADEHAYFAIPKTLDMNGYSDRFAAEMRGHANHEPDEETIEATFRAQAVWDATMARSIAEAKNSGATKVVQLVGRFHSDFNGGTIQEIQYRIPFARILIISGVQSDSREFNESDRGRADLVFYVSPSPEENNSEDDSE